MLWMIRVVGVLALQHRDDPLPARIEQVRVANATDDDWKRIVSAALALATDDFQPADANARIYSVSLNRQAAPTVSRSTLAVKADAARRLFAIDCSELVWAVIDSGIDARHPAFGVRERGQAAEVAALKPNESRVKGTYDFNGLDMLLDPVDREELPRRLRQRLEAPGGDELRRHLDDLYRNVDNGRPLDWGILAPLLEVPHDASYEPPVNDHGTHVAGILAGDWRTYDSQSAGFDKHLTGMCPDLRLYDLRVLDHTGRGDEFAVMAALQLVRHLNTSNDFMAVHGVNLSLSIPHDVSNYACGRTPVCDECEHVVRAGIVVVAAAGNQGYRKLPSPEGGMMELYSSSSITDPGNADQVITVGATHRYRPHMYGVSYFSSRGPTGDGRVKPDLVAPGEKIAAPIPNEGYGVKDGTSMAAPHVSGAAALLMARHNELVGRPARVKQILCSTATDLGRERYFQGAGMLDVLRALQSI
jgi:subtilisin family serine protease